MVAPCTLFTMQKRKNVLSHHVRIQVPFTLKMEIAKSARPILTQTHLIFTVLKRPSAQPANISRKTVTAQIAKTLRVSTPSMTSSKSIAK